MCSNFSKYDSSFPICEQGGEAAGATLKRVRAGGAIVLMACVLDQLRRALLGGPEPSELELRGCLAA